MALGYAGSVHRFSYEPGYQRRGVRDSDGRVLRIEYGKIFIEATVAKGKVTNVQFETKRSRNVNH
jgi:hypothetical protein